MVMVGGRDQLRPQLAVQLLSAAPDGPTPTYNAESPPTHAF